MARTETYQTLLDRASTPVQTHIILAQLAILRKLDKARNERGESFVEAVLTLTLLIILGGMVVKFLVAAQVL